MTKEELILARRADAERIAGQAAEIERLNRQVAWRIKTMKDMDESYEGKISRQDQQLAALWAVAKAADGLLNWEGPNGKLSSQMVVKYKAARAELAALSGDKGKS